MLVSTSQEVFQVSTVTPYKSVQDVIDYAKAHPGKLNYYSVGIGSTSHLSTVLFMDVTAPDAACAVQPDGAGHHRRADRRTKSILADGQLDRQHPRARCVRWRPARSLHAAARVPTDRLGIKMGEVELVRVLGARKGTPRPSSTKSTAIGEGSGAARDQGARDAARLSVHRRLAGETRRAPEERKSRNGTRLRKRAARSSDRWCGRSEGRAPSSCRSALPSAAAESLGPARAASNALARGGDAGGIDRDLLKASGAADHLDFGFEISSDCCNRFGLAARHQH